jgi:hypothetical protein
MSLASRGATIALVALLPRVGAAQQPAAVRLHIQYASSLMSLRDTFAFTIDGDRRTLVHMQSQTTLVPGTFVPGARYTIAQVAGPRTCTFPEGASGTVPSTDGVISVDCGMPPLAIGRMRITGLAPGETFRMTDDYRRSLTAPVNAASLNLGGFPVGDETRFTQAGGTRPCVITPSGRFTVPSGQFTVTADCAPPAPGVAAPPAPTPYVPGPAPAPGAGTPGTIAGTLAAPPGTRIVLESSRTDSLVVVATREGTALFTSTPFAFRGALGPTQSYTVAVRRAPPGVRCAIGDASGSAGAPRPVRVACGPEWEHVSRGSAPTARATFYAVQSAVIGGQGPHDGRYVAFAGDLAGVDGSTGRVRQVFWRDRWTNTTRLVSVAADGREGDKASTEPAISADGQSVAFASAASNLPGADSDGYRDVFVWRAATGKVERVSVAANGTPADRESTEPSVSGDGTLVAFSSSATTLAGGPRLTSGTDVYVKDTRSGALTLVSLEERRQQGGGGARPSISEDGTRVAFHSVAALRNDDGNGLWDIYLWERGAPALRRISLTTTGAERSQGSESASRVVTPTISTDGRWVTFATTATSMGGDVGTAQQAYAVDLESGRVVRVSMNRDGVVADGDTPVGQGERVSISGNGSAIAWTTAAKNMGGSMIVRHAITGETSVLAETGARIGPPMLSRDGLFILVPSGENRDPRVPSSGIFVKVR